MGICHAKVIANPKAKCDEIADSHTTNNNNNNNSNLPFFTPSPLSRKRRSRPFPPPSPAKHIKELLARRRHGCFDNPINQQQQRRRRPSIPEEADVIVNTEFGYSNAFLENYEMGEEIGRGHFGFTCTAKPKPKPNPNPNKGRRNVAVKIIPKSKMTTAVAVEDVKREVKILQALNGHNNNLVQFHQAFEDHHNVYIIMELCKGGELLDRMLSRGGIYSEEDAKVVMVQILSAVAFCHLQGVVHRDLKPENFLFTTKEEHSALKLIDFGLSDYVNPDDKLSDIVGSAYYVAPEVLHRSYGTEADMWSIGVIAYILLCGSRPFWAETESAVFRTVLKIDPSFDQDPWPSLSSEAKHFVQALLHKDQHMRLTAAQALCHPWFTNHPHVNSIPLDMIVYRLVAAYIDSSSLRKLALNALAKTLSFVHLSYLRKQFDLLGPNENGFISLKNFKTALMKASTDAMNDSGVTEYVDMVSSYQYKRLDFEEFCGAALSVHQLKGSESWEVNARYAYDLFEEYGNRPIMIEELHSELGLAPSIPLHVVIQDWIRPSDGKLSFLGFIKLLNGVAPCTNKQEDT